MMERLSPVLEDGGSCVLSIRPPAHLPINIPVFLFCCRFTHRFVQR